MRIVVTRALAAIALIGVLAGQSTADAATDVKATVKPAKIAVCHRTASAKNPIVLLSIDSSALAAHKAHGDTLAVDGACAATASDATAPIISSTVYPLANAAGWHSSNVTVLWSLRDAESGIASATGCGTSETTVDTFGSMITCSAANGAGLTSRSSVLVRLDKFAPNIEAAVDRQANAFDWYNAPVVIDFQCFDALSGVTDCPAPTSLGDEGAAQSVTATATDVAGNSTSTVSSPVNIDLTSPTVGFTGNTGDYLVDQFIAIRYAGSDALAGLDVLIGTGAAGPAYSFALGANTLAAFATDRAGNTGSAFTSFDVRVTHDSLCGLTRRFVTNDGVENSLCKKLTNSAAARTRGDVTAANNILDAYTHEVEAITSKWITAADAAVLVRLVKALY